jgi:hypothetical protein
MVQRHKSIGAMVLRLMVVLTLLACPRVGAAQGTWSVIATSGDALGQVDAPTALAMDAPGNLYVADGGGSGGDGRIQKRDAQGNWSVIATYGDALGQVNFDLSGALAVDLAGSLYVADSAFSGNGYGRIQERDAQGNWSVIATSGDAPGQVTQPNALAVDTTGNLYVADYGGIQKRDAQGRWSILDFDQWIPLAADAAGNLYVISDGIQKRDAQGNWSVIAVTACFPGQSAGESLGEVCWPTALAVDAADNLYIAEDLVVNGFGDNVGVCRIQQRDARGHWSVIAASGYGLDYASALVVDRTGNLYVADGESDWVQKYTPDH